jgi:hypothetical protein
VDRTLTSFLDSKKQQTTPEAEPEAETELEKKQTRFIKLPYVSRKCEDYAHRLKRLVTNNFPQLDFNVAFQSPHTIGKLFPFKDKIQDTLKRSMVVYSIKCEECQAEYVGKTVRVLGCRIIEHQKQKASACQQHTREHPGHTFDYSKVEIVDTADSDFSLRCKELLHILDRRPELNKQLGQKSKYEIKTLIIQAHPQRLSSDE